MSLNFNVSKVANREELWVDTAEGRQLAPRTRDLIFACLAFDLGTITPENIDEWLWRQKFYDRLFDALYYKRGENGPVPNDFTREELERHIGLKTNVPDKSRKAWLKIKVDTYVRENL